MIALGVIGVVRQKLANDTVNCTYAVTNEGVVAITLNV